MSKVKQKEKQPRWWRRDTYDHARQRKRADIAIVVIVLMTLSAIALSSYFFSAYIAIQSVARLNTEQINNWRKITDQVNYLLTQGDSITESVVIDKVQANLKQLLLTEAQLRQSLQDKTQDLHIRCMFLVSHPEADQLRKLNIKPVFRQRVVAASLAPMSIIESGFSYWDAGSILSFQSGTLLEPLYGRESLLSSIQERSIERLWLFLGGFSFALLSVVLLAWHRILRPAFATVDDMERERHLLLDNVPALVASYTTGDWKLAAANSAYAETFNLEKWKDSGQVNIKELIGEENWKRVESHFMRAAAGEIINYDVEMLFHGRGYMRNATYVPVVDEHGDIGRIIVLSTNIHERFMTEKALRLSEENLRITLNSIGEAVVAIDIDGKVQRMNPVACQLTGWELQAALGRPFAEVYQIVDAVTRIPQKSCAEKVRKSGESMQSEVAVQLLARDGKEYSIKSAGYPILNDDDRMAGVVQVFRDVTEEALLNEKLLQGEKMQAIGQLAGGIAHDLNNHLAIISGAAELITFVKSLPPVVEKHVDNICKTTRQAAELIQSLNAFARLPDELVRQFDVEEQLQKTLQLLRSTNDRRVEFVLQSNVQSSVLRGNRSRLQAVFMNLCVNAVQAMPDGGTLCVKLNSIELGSHDCNRYRSFALLPGDYLQIDFLDTGVGINPEIMPHIFEPFFTTKSASQGGTGLGLAAVYGTILEYGGAVTAHSRPEGGARFSILLPRTSSSTVVDIASPNYSPVQSTERSECCILLVDDEESLRLNTAERLAILGCTSLHASDGVEALKVYASRGNEIDMIMLDMNMPNMNGLETLKQLKQINPNIKVAIVTGFTEDTHRLEEEDNTVFAFLRKPYSLGDLSDLLSSFFAFGQSIR